jgi:hypothetical protein
MLNLIEHLEVDRDALMKIKEKHPDLTDSVGWDLIRDDINSINEYLESLAKTVKILEMLADIPKAQRLHGEAKHWENIIAWANIQDYSIKQGEPALV